MGIHYYDECPETVQTQMLRLEPAAALIAANIPCLVWAEDTLSFIHFVPTYLFALQLLVPDDKVENAAAVITSGMPYERTDKPHNSWLENRLFDPERNSVFPSASLYLKSTIPTDLRNEDTPGDVYIHPQSFWNIDVADHSRSVTLASTLPPAFAAVRFPTRPAFLDSLFDTQIDPPHGRRLLRLSMFLGSFIGYFFTYTLRADPRVLPDGQLEPEHAMVCASLRPENQNLFKEFMRAGQRTEFDPDGNKRRLARREFLKAQGYSFFLLIA
ncbi:hypothetical protein B0H11DRAFT_1295037 [Mycena galericulata]|nr:hypothetical protein B0H11DRAFT_1295037 [Mycena galericulata]